MLWKCQHRISHKWHIVSFFLYLFPSFFIAHAAFLFCDFHCQQTVLVQLIQLIIPPQSLNMKWCISYSNLFLMRWHHFRSSCDLLHQIRKLSRILDLFDFIIFSWCKKLHFDAKFITVSIYYCINRFLRYGQSRILWGFPQTKKKMLKSYF